MIQENRNALIDALAAHRQVTEQIESKLKQQIHARTVVGNVTAGQDTGMIGRISVDDYESSYNEVRRIFAATEPESTPE